MAIDAKVLRAATANSLALSDVVIAQDLLTERDDAHLSPTDTLADAMQLLAELPRVAGNPHVFPGRKAGAHLVNVNRLWASIRKKAQIEDVRLHDLRHTFASVAVSSGASLPLIGGLLGHAKASTTQRYAHLSDDPLRAVAERAGEVIEAAMRKTK